MTVFVVMAGTVHQGGQVHGVFCDLPRARMRAYNMRYRIDRGEWKSETFKGSDTIDLWTRGSDYVSIEEHAIHDWKEREANGRS